MKKIILGLCVLGSIFLTSCEKDSQDLSAHCGEKIEGRHINKRSGNWYLDFLDSDQAGHLISIVVTEAEYNYYTRKDTVDCSPKK